MFIEILRTYPAITRPAKALRGCARSRSRFLQRNPRMRPYCQLHLILHFSSQLLTPASSQTFTQFT